jgi:hypothetical protein
VQAEPGLRYRRAAPHASAHPLDSSVRDRHHQASAGRH